MSDTKPCPYCGEPILSVAIKCKHCGSNIEGPAHTAKSQFRMRAPFAIALCVILLIVGAGAFLNWNRTGTLSGRGFSDVDVSRIEQSIREEFAKRGGVKVEQVKMIRETATKMTGFAKIHVPLLGSVNKTCSATMGQDGQTMWQCN